MKIRGKSLVLASMGLVATLSMTGCGSEPQQDALPAGSTVVLARVDDVTAQNPDLVLLGVGGNDVLQRVQPETTRANITATIDTLKSENIDVILIAEPYFSASALFGRVSDNPVYEDIADTKEVPLYSGGWSEVLSDDTLKSDRIHANAAGYRHFAEGLHDYLQEEGVAR